MTEQYGRLALCISYLHCTYMNKVCSLLLLSLITYRLRINIMALLSFAYFLDYLDKKKRKVKQVSDPKGRKSSPFISPLNETA